MSYVRKNDRKEKKKSSSVIELESLVVLDNFQENEEGQMILLFSKQK